jgi:tellurite resistance protein TerC
MILFPFAEYWWFYAIFTLFVLGMLALDLGVFHRKAHEVSFKEATIWSGVWVTLALLFNFGLYRYALWKFPQDDRLGAIPGFDSSLAAWNVGMEFLTGYVIEKSLSVDNIFIFVMVFAYFAIPAKYQHRVLFYGIVGALFFRAFFIAMGSALMQFHWVIYLFGAFLILTGVKMFFSHSEEIEPEKNLLIRLFRRWMPVSPSLDDDRFFSRIDNRWHATPLFIALLFLEATDIIFAVDSVPAIFAITDEPMIVFTSNIFAILGLRSMYFMLAGVIDKFHLLKYGLATVLVFVGLKMVWLNDAFGGKFPVAWSLAFITAAIGLSVVASLLFPSRISGPPMADEKAGDGLR